jgi:hypothetical protein
MNDELRQKLSEYLDGVLPAAEAAALERAIAKSPELLAELEELRAVSKLVKDLPREPLPAGFRARLERRRAAEDAPASERTDWVFLAPAYRPFAAALSGLIVAVVVWDKVGPRQEAVIPYDHVAVLGADSAPPVQYELAKKIGLGVEMDRTASEEGGVRADKPEFLPPAVEVPEDERQAALVAKRERVRAKGGPLDGEASVADGLAGLNAVPAPRAPAPGMAPMGALAEAKKTSLRSSGAAAAVRGAAESPAPLDGSARPQTEEERSARNEEMYQAFEREKRKMGIAGFASKSDAAAQRVLSAGGSGAPARIDSMTPNLLGARNGVLPRALRSESAYREAWTSLKLAGEPPPVDFAKTMLVVLPEPGAVVSADEGPSELLVTWRPLPGAGPADRLRPVALSGKPVRLLRGR